MGNSPALNGTDTGGRQNAGRWQNDAALAKRAEPMLPPGTNLETASAGFRNQGEFMGALNASHNLGIPFDQLKQQMTGGNRKSLGDAIHTLRPDMDRNSVKQSVKQAERSSREERHASKTSGPEGPTAAAIRNNPGLSSRVSSLLPPGTTLDQASSGFKNTGQFVAALHVSKNLDIPFSDLRARMIAGGESLGEAIHALRPAMPETEIDAGVRNATEAAQGDLEARSESAAGLRTRQ